MMAALWMAVKVMAYLAICGAAVFAGAWLGAMAMTWGRDDD